MAEPAKQIEVEIVGREMPGDERARTEALLRQLARLMDDCFVIPGTGIRFGLDPILGLIPGLGDAAGALVASFLLAQAKRLGVPRIVMLRMAANIFLNAALGAVPVFGDIFSVGFKSNLRNMELLRRHAGSRPPATGGDWLFVGALLLALLAAVAIAVAAAALALRWVAGFLG